MRGDKTKQRGKQVPHGLFLSGERKQRGDDPPTATAAGRAGQAPILPRPPRKANAAGARGAGQVVGGWFFESSQTKNSSDEVFRQFTDNDPDDPDFTRVKKEAHSTSHSNVLGGGAILSGGKKAGATVKTFARENDTTDESHGIATVSIPEPRTYWWSEKSTWHENVGGTKTTLFGLGEPRVVSDSTTGTSTFMYNRRGCTFYGSSERWHVIEENGERYFVPVYPAVYIGPNVSLESSLIARSFNAATSEWEDVAENWTCVYYDIDTGELLGSWTEPLSISYPPPATPTILDCASQLAALAVLCGPPEWPVALDIPAAPQYPGDDVPPPPTGEMPSIPPGGLMPITVLGPGGAAYDDADWLDQADRFFAGFSDEVSWGTTTWLRGWIYGDIATRNHQGAMFHVGQAVGIAHTMALGGALGWSKAGAQGAGREFSHWIPKRWGGPRSLWNGNFVPREVHALSDPFRYQFMPAAWKTAHAMPGVVSQQLMRIPYVYVGIGAGGVYGAGGLCVSSMINDSGVIIVDPSL